MSSSYLYELMLKGGPLVWPIIGCSVLGLAIFLERSFYLSRLWKGEKTLIKEMEEYSGVCSIRKFLDNVDLNNGPAGRMLAEAGDICCSDKGVLEAVLDYRIDAEIGSASKHMDFMATLAAVSPLLGLLGTVTGLIKAFMIIEAAGGRVNAGMLAGGIWEAMLTTALGLAVAIILVLGHRLLMARIRLLEEHLQRAAVFFLKHFFSASAKQPGHVL